MNPLARVGGLTILCLAVAIPVLAAQDKDAKKDEKPEVKKDVKKDEAKKDDPKKEDPKKSAKEDDKKKTDKKDKTKPPEEEKLVWGNMVKAKLARMDASSKGGFAIQPVDPFKVGQFNAWKLQQMQSIATATNPTDYVNRMQSYQSQLQAKAGDIFGKEVEVRPADKMKIRVNFPPTKYDDNGNLVKWTAKDLKELKGNSKLPGYPGELSDLRAGQQVDVYFAKVPPPPPGSKGKKKNIEDEIDAMMARPEVVLIVVTMEAPMRQ